MGSWESEDIRRFRQRLRLSRKDFGEMVGTSGNYIYLLERGDRQAGKTLKILLSMMEKQETETKGGNQNGSIGGVPGLPQETKLA